LTLRLNADTMGSEVLLSHAGEPQPITSDFSFLAQAKLPITQSCLGGLDALFKESGLDVKARGARANPMDDADVKVHRRPVAGK
jgi:hypothetical protein